MADSIGDISLANVWVDIYDESGITAGTSIVGVNKTAGPILIWEGATAPSVATWGTPVKPYDAFKVTTGASGVWVFGSGPITVQEA